MEKIAAQTIKAVRQKKRQTAFMEASSNLYKLTAKLSLLEGCIEEDIRIKALSYLYMEAKKIETKYLNEIGTVPSFEESDIYRRVENEFGDTDEAESRLQAAYDEFMSTEIQKQIQQVENDVHEIWNLLYKAEQKQDFLNMFRETSAGETAKPKRIINTEKFAMYFKAQFKGIAGTKNDVPNHFATLIENLKDDRTGKEFAAIALIIHESKKVNMKKDGKSYGEKLSWAKWYPIFCECVDCEKKQYEPHHLRKTIDKFRQREQFTYLLDGK